MNAERLIAHYERIADAPDAIARLRRFILDLAVRGKLVPQEAKDEPASAILIRIALDKERICNRQLEPTEISGAEQLGKLPNGWVAIPLIALGSWAIGSGFPKNEQGLDKGPHFFLKVSDMNLPGNEKYITTSNNFIDDNAAARMRARVHPAGTIIFPKIGGAIATNKRRILTRGSAIDNNCLGITFSGEIDIEWAYLLLTTFDFSQYQVGTAVPALQQNVLERIPINLPPRAEQHRIVAKVSELMTLCDQLETARAKRETTRNRLAAASLARLNTPDPETFQADARFVLNTLPTLTTRPDQIKQLRQTILNLAVRGKVVPQDISDEPASELIQRIAKEKQRVGVKPLAAPSRGNQVIPTGWHATTIGGYAIDVFTGPFGSALHQHDYVEGGVPLINPSHMKNDRIAPDPKISVPPAIAQRLSSYAMEAGDIVMARRGEVGRAALVEPHQKGWLCGTGSFFLRFTSDVNRHYLLLVLRTSQLREFLAGEAIGTTMVNLNHNILKRAPLDIPPLAEQHRIVAKVDELMTLCDQLEASLTTSEATRRRLLDALLFESLSTLADAA